MAESQRFLRLNRHSWLLTLLDHSIALLLVPLAIWFFLSGMDDLLVDLVSVFRVACLKYRNQYTNQLPSDSQLANLPEKSIAIVVPLWREHEVIRPMVEHNRSAIRYRNYHFFVGAYPNDDSTIDAITELETRFPNVHLALCPHDGPTSKADCLNWIYQRILLYEADHSEKFEILVTHDAEDLIHADSLQWINYYADTYEMIQIPVLPLPTSISEWTHGVYCDEFSEYQTRDMPARQFMGAFVPSCGVGTGFTRAAIESLASTENNRIFEPTCLTEDYENGIRLRLKGARQAFMPLTTRNGSIVATREFFPRRFRSAVRQRTRWVTGIALQGWERHHWEGPPVVKYWLWRDRKGVLGNPLSLLTNGILIYGIYTWIASRVFHTTWGLGAAALHPALNWLMPLNGAMGLWRLLVRAWCVGRVCGWGFAVAVPLRIVLANIINSLSSLAALHQYFTARIRKVPLRWLKTEHAYPTLAGLHQHKLKLGQVLVGSQYITEDDLAGALATLPPGMRLGEYLIALECLSEDELYEALSLQQSLPVASLDADEVDPAILRSLPAKLLRFWRVIPFKVESGKLHIAGPELPTDDLQRAVRQFSALDLRFHLITPTGFDQFMGTSLR
jgi:adsorption protein B